MVPISTNDVSGAPRWRNFVRSPMDSTPTTGQNSSSKKKKTLREAIRRLRSAKAQTATRSARQLNEDLLELGLADPHVAHDHALRMEGLQQRRQALVGIVDHALHPTIALGIAQHAGELRDPSRRRRIEPERDDIPDGDLTLELGRSATREDQAALDEGDLVAQLLGLAHVVG